MVPVDSDPLPAPTVLRTWTQLTVDPICERLDASTKRALLSIFPAERQTIFNISSGNGRPRNGVGRN